MNSEDKKLVAAAQKNSADFEVLYHKYAEKVFNYFWYRIGHDTPTAENLMQETFIRAFEKLPTFENKDYSYQTYLLTIAHNILVDYFRKKRPVPLEEIEKVPSEVHNIMTHKLEGKLLWEMIQTALSDNEKSALLMFYRKEMSIKDIAKVMDKSENAVKLLLSRARKKLSEHPYLQDLSGFVDTQWKKTKARFLQE